MGKTFYVAGKLQTVPIASIVVDSDAEGYQREAKNKKDGDIGGERFNPLCVLPPLVNIRHPEDKNPLYYAMDGGHRKQWAMKEGYDSIECLVYFNLTKKQEADVFLSLATGTRTITPWEWMKAALVAEWEEAVGVDRIIHHHGLNWTLDRKKFGATDTDFDCPMVLVKMFKDCEDHFDSLIYCLANGWRVGPRNPRLQLEARNVDTLRAFNRFLLKHSDDRTLTDNKVIRILKKNPAGDVANDARGRLGLKKNGEVIGGARAIQSKIVEVLEERFGYKPVDTTSYND